MRMTAWMTASILSALAGCAGPAMVHPHDMSTTGHEAAAERAEGQASEHAGRFDRGATRPAGNCTASPREYAPPCWTSVVNPTERHLRDAEEHRHLAGAHRSAGAALQDAEARACGGLSPDERDVSPFYHREDIARVEGTPRGATVFFRPVPGLDEAALRRVVECHLARNAALGHEAPWMAYCPLVPNGVSARVYKVGRSLAVAIESDDRAVAGEVARRATALRVP